MAQRKVNIGIKQVGPRVTKTGWENLVPSDLPDTGVTPGSYTSADITIDAQGRITLAANGSGGAGGTVTSVDISGSGSGLTFTGGPITTSGTFLLGGILTIPFGGTGQSTANGALNALLPNQSGNAGKALITDGSDTAWVDVAFTPLDYQLVYRVRVATIGNVNLTNQLENGDSIDGVTLATGDLVLVWIQTDAKENGIYVVQASGAAVRWTQHDTDAEIRGHRVYITEGSTYARKGFVNSNTSAITIGVTNIAYTRSYLGDNAIVAANAYVGVNSTLDDGASIGAGASVYPGVTVSGNCSGTNTGDQTITLTGDVTGTGTGSFATAIANNTVTDGKLRDSAALSVIGRSANSSGDPADIAAANDGEVLRRSGTTLGFGTVALAGGLNITGGTSADPAMGDELPGYDLSATANRKFQVDRLLGLLRLNPGGRLTLTSGSPVTSSDVTGATTIYYTPYLNDVIPLWDGTRWVWTQFAEVSIALGTVTASLPYDIFGYLSGGTLTLEKVAWTDATTRATAITIQDGRYCKSGDKTRLYLGTFYTTSTTTTEDSKAKRLVWSMYNRVLRPLKRFESAVSWTYNSSTTRQANANTANKVEVVIGIQGTLVDLSVSELCILTGGGSYISIGEDSTTTTHSDCAIAQAASNATVAAFLRTIPTAGYHAYNWLERTDTNNTHFGNSTFGLTGSIMI